MLQMNGLEHLLHEFILTDRDSKERCKGIIYGLVTAFVACGYDKDYVLYVIAKNMPESVEAVNHSNCPPVYVQRINEYLEV